MDCCCRCCDRRGDGGGLPAETSSYGMEITEIGCGGGGGRRCRCGCGCCCWCLWFLVIVVAFCFGGGGRCCPRPRPRPCPRPRHHHNTAAIAAAAAPAVVVVVLHDISVRLEILVGGCAYCMLSLLTLSMSFLLHHQIGSSVSS